ncbi:sensor histidine kinase [Paenibacillus methanolicus]|uniref:histidine kinase n=1 Tax=Paenibacillus methanolicus TaxID=582686 RepID=A0A5S5CAT1_9BACL|nr:sensor histidine kinase [Paenibacillus methanolicus]TYP76511.1 signal transduction histidine kinase [Paenibacillus methanolicus]
MTRIRNWLCTIGMASLSLLLFAIFCLLLTWNTLGGREADESRLLHLSSGWQIHLGDLAVEANALAASEGWRPFKIEDADSLLDGYQGYYWLRYRLPEQLRDEPNLHVQGFKHAELYTRSGQIYAFNMDRDVRLVNKELRWGIADLKPEDYGHPLYARVYQDGGDPAEGLFRVGRMEHFMTHMLRSDAFRYLSCVVGLIAGMLAFILYALNRKDPIYLHFALFSVCVAYGSIVRAASLQLFADIPLLVYIQNIALPLGTGALLGFLAETFAGGWRIWFRRLAAAYYSFGLIVFAAAFINDWLYHMLVEQLFAVTAVPLVLCILLGLYRSGRHENRLETRLIMAGIWLLGIFTAVHYIDLNYYSISSRLFEPYPVAGALFKEAFVQLAVFGFILCLAGVLLVRYAKTHRQVKRYAHELALKNDQLEAINRQRAEELRQRTEELQEAIQVTMDTMEEVVALEERNRIAHEMHDTVGHTLTATIMQMEVTKRLFDTDREAALQRLASAQDLVRSGLDQVRSSVRLMKDEAPAYDLRDAMIVLMRNTTQATQVDIQYRIDPLPQLPPGCSKVLYHALLEGLTNGMRHGRGTRFNCELTVGEDGVLLLLQNNGLPYDNSAYGFGLTAMNERVQLVGGSLRVSQSAEWGCELRVRLPLASTV